MSVNKYLPHVFVLPEDDANRQMATGFVLEVDGDRQIQILPEAGGWLRVLELFLAEHVSAMRRFPKRHIVLLMDFDNQEQRSAQVMTKVPDDLKDRVFILGSRSEPEILKQASGLAFEEVGKRLGRECRAGGRAFWLHALLCHNAPEVARLEPAVSSILFRSRA